MPAYSRSLAVPGAPRLPLSAKLLRRCLRSRLRGTTRLSTYLLRYVPSLRAVPVQVASGQVLYMDMRDEEAHGFLFAPPHEGPTAWEPDEQQVMRRVVREGEIAFDVGAHVGEHSALLAHLVGSRGQVCAFEPNQERRTALERTVTQRGNGRLLPFALSDAPGRRTLFVPENHSMASLADWTRGEGGAVRGVSCEKTTLDHLVERQVVPVPDFVKCDVEGAEYAVFRGSARTLDRADAPIVLYEANVDASNAFGLPARAATDFLVGLAAPRYAIFWVRPGGQLERIADLRSDVRLFNLLAVPWTKMDRIA